MRLKMLTVHNESSKPASHSVGKVSVYNKDISSTKTCRKAFLYCMCYPPGTNVPQA